MLKSASTLNDWVNRKRNYAEGPGHVVDYKSRKRGPKSQLPAEVEKWALNNMKVYQEKGVTITFAVVKYVTK